MYSFFGEPRDTHRTRRRQDRQDFFPSFSNSLFSDPFSQLDRPTSQSDYDMDDPELYTDHRLKPRLQKPQHQRPQHHQQQHLRQQEEQRRRTFWEQQQRQNDDEDEDEEEEDDSERLRQIAKQQRQQQLLHQQQQQLLQQQQQQLLQHQQQQHRAAAERKAKQQQQHPPTQDTSPAKHSHRPTRTQRQLQEQQRKPEESSSKRNRRQRRRDRQGCRLDGESTATSAPQESIDDMQSLVESAFGEKTMLSDSPGQVPKPKVTSVSEYEDDSDEASDHINRDQENSATEEYSADEEESIQPDPEQQQRSLVELHEIECSLQELSQELNKILSGEISNKKHILLTEENLTRAMLRIDAVESGGDDSVRKQRKGLIDKAERLLEKVDEYKRRTKTSAFSRSH